MRAQAPRDVTITSKHIEMYHVVSVTGSTLAASARLGLSQSSVSRMLAQLEAYLGVRLFDRDKNRLLPTQEGLHLGPRIRAISEELEALRRSARELGKGNSRAVLLRVAFPGSLTNRMVPGLLKGFFAKHDQARVEVAVDTYTGIERMIAEGEVELGFLRLPIQTAGLVAQATIESDTVCVVPSGHALAPKPVLSPREINRFPLILLGRGRAARVEIENAFYREGLTANAKVEAHTVGSACALAAEGVGIAIVNRLMAEEYRHLPVVLVPLAPEITQHYTIATRERPALSNIATLFLRHVEEHLGQAT